MRQHCLHDVHWFCVESSKTCRTNEAALFVYARMLACVLQWMGSIFNFILLLFFLQFLLAFFLWCLIQTWVLLADWIWSLPPHPQPTRSQSFNYIWYIGPSVCLKPEKDMHVLQWVWCWEFPLDPTPQHRLHRICLAHVLSPHLLSYINSQQKSYNHFIIPHHCQ